VTGSDGCGGKNGSRGVDEISVRISGDRCGTFHLFRWTCSLPVLGRVDSSFGLADVSSEKSSVIVSERCHNLRK